MEKTTKDFWEYILINGKANKIQVKNPDYKNGRLISIDGLKPFDKKDDQGVSIQPTVDDANDKKRKYYNEFFKKPFKNVLVLSGAGSSMDVGGLSMNQLWKETETFFKTKVEEKEIDGFKTIRDEVNFTSTEKNLELFLSHLEGYSKFVQNKQIEVGTKKWKLSEIQDVIFNLIKDKCTIPTPAGSFPHKTFLEKLLQRKQTNPRIKVFTLNYDLLFEKAATDVNAIVVDGFSFTYPRIFSGRYFDYDFVQREGSKLKEEDNFVQRVFHLHKLHGSLNWEKNGSNQITVKENTKKPLMVYPRDAKYEDSYGQPFFEMMARFQRNLRKNNDTILICIGYSFNDKHINAAIEEALNQNPGFRLACIDPGIESKHISSSLKQIKNTALESERILLVSETFTDFANHYPEIKTYESQILNHITLNDE